MAENTIHRQKSKFGGMEFSEEQQLKPFEAEHAKLKRLNADAMLDNQPLRQINAISVGAQHTKGRTAMH